MQHTTEKMQHATYTIAAPKYAPRPNVSSCFDWEKTESFFITRTYASVTHLRHGTGGRVTSADDPFATKSTT